MEDASRETTGATPGKARRCGGTFQGACAYQARLNLGPCRLQPPSKDIGVRGSGIIGEIDGNYSIYSLREWPLLFEHIDIVRNMV